MVAHQHRDCIGAAHALYDLQHRLKRVSVIEAVKKLSENLGIGLRFELPALLFKLGFQLKIILNNAVVDEGDAPARARVGMGVCIGRRAVGRPAGTGGLRGEIEISPGPLAKKILPQLYPRSTCIFSYRAYALGAGHRAAKVVHQRVRILFGNAAIYRIDEEHRTVVVVTVRYSPSQF